VPVIIVLHAGRCVCVQHVRHSAYRARRPVLASVTPECASPDTAATPRRRAKVHQIAATTSAAYCTVFYRASSYVNAALAVVNLSVSPSVTRVLLDKTKQCTADILIPHDTNRGWWATTPSV